MNLRMSQALSIFGERRQGKSIFWGGEAVKEHLCGLFFLAAAARRFLDKFLVWKINFCTRPTGPPALAARRA